MNILNCMPEDVWEVQDDTGTEEEVRLKRPVLPSDWERPLIYSRRVRHYELSGSSPASAAFYEMLRMCLPPERLFANTESLVWQTSDAALLPHFRLFIGPRLTSLTVSTFQSASHLSLLPALARECPLLRDVFILTSDGLPGRCEAVSFFVKHLARLESLQVPCLNVEALNHLAKCSALDYLYLNDQTPLTSVFELGSQAEVTSSCDIDTLTLTVTDAHAATEVITRLHASFIRSLVIRFPKNTSATAVLDIYNGVAANCNHMSLTSLSIAPPTAPGIHIAAATANPEQIALYAVPSTHLLPLFTFTTLTSVTLAGPVGLDLDDASAADIAHAWPRITLLNLAGSALAHLPPRTTLRALLAFAQHCPRLWYLYLPIDARNAPGWETPQAPAKARPTQRCLVYLDVGLSPIGTPLDVAAYLSGIFPKLQGVSTGRGDSARDQASQRKWNDVEAALPALRRVRAEEKYWTERECEGD